MASLLSASKSLSELIRTKPLSSSVGNINVIETGDNNVTICYLPYLHPFTGDGTPINNIGQYEGLAAIFLAMEHLNTGDGAIIPELDGIHQRCPLRFTTKAFDTNLQERVGVNHIIHLTDRSKTDQLLPCAILGSGKSSISMPTSIISGLRGFPQISPISTSTTLDDKTQYKLFGRTIPNDDGTAIPLLKKLTSWGVHYLAVLHSDDAYGNAFAEGIRLGAQREAPNLLVQTVEISTGADDEAISKAVQQLKELQYTYFFGIIFPEEFVDRVMTEAYNQGIAGTGQHTWLFSDSVGSTVTGRGFPVGSPLEKAYRGTGVLSAVGGIPGIESFDKLTTFMQQIGENEEDLSLIGAHLPQDYSSEISVNHSIVTSQEAFLKAPGIVAPFLYDAVIALGLASCGLVETSGNNEYFTGEELFQAFINTTINGTSGLIVLDPNTGTRDPRSAFFSLINFIVDEDAGLDQDLVQFKGAETDLFKAGDWESLVPYTFNSGSSDTPSDLPVLETIPNYLSTGLIVVGSILCAIIVALALSFSFWANFYSNKKVVRSSQPIFLHIISAGTILMGLSIIPFTIDLGVTDQKGADTACMSFPWLLTIGFSLTFSALFTKTYRINQIMKSAARFQRLKLTPADVIKPMIALLTINVLVLTVWTVVDPRQRKTVVVSQDSFDRDLETYGTCNSEYDFIFLAILGTINIGSLLYAVFQAYKARDISTELQESSYIFMAMALILLVSLIGIPVMIIARENITAFYFVSVCLIFVVSASVLLLIFIPKILAIGGSSSGSDGRGVSRVGSMVWKKSAVQSELEKEILELKRLLLMREKTVCKDCAARDVGGSKNCNESSLEDFGAEIRQESDEGYNGFLKNPSEAKSDPQAGTI